MRTPGEIITRTRRGVVIRYAPRQGSSRKYDVVCPHGSMVMDRTQEDARESARLVDEWCLECAAGMSPEESFA
jgi:hypothetical protein